MPEPARTEKRSPSNLPEYVILTAEKLANVRNSTLEHIAEITTRNAIALFDLKV
jgi:Tat protein secretion system quality control protein TatD with DNase activity